MNRISPDGVENKGSCPLYFAGTGDEIMNWDSTIDDDLEIELYA